MCCVLRFADFQVPVEWICGTISVAEAEAEADCSNPSLSAAYAYTKRIQRVHSLHSDET